MKTKHRALAFVAMAAAGLAFQAGAADKSPLSARDQEFVKNAAIAGMSEVEQGKLAKQRGGDRVRGFASTMVQDHGKANDKLKALAHANGWTLPSGPDDKAKDAIAALAAKSGAEFDQAYASNMQSDHDQAVALFKDEAANGGNAELKQFAQGTLPTLERHQKMAYDLKSTNR